MRKLKRVRSIDYETLSMRQSNVNKTDYITNKALKLVTQVGLDIGEEVTHSGVCKFFKN